MKSESEERVRDSGRESREESSSSIYIYLEIKSWYCFWKKVLFLSFISQFYVFIFSFMVFEIICLSSFAKKGWRKLKTAFIVLKDGAFLEGPSLKMRVSFLENGCRKQFHIGFHFLQKQVHEIEFVKIPNFTYVSVFLDYCNLIIYSLMGYCNFIIYSLYLRLI